MLRQKEGIVQGLDRRQVVVNKRRLRFWLLLALGVWLLVVVALVVLAMVTL